MELEFLTHISSDQLEIMKAEAAINEYGKLSRSQSQNRAGPRIFRKRNPSGEQLPKNKIDSQQDLPIRQVHCLPPQSSFNSRVKILDESGAGPSASRLQSHPVNPSVYRDPDVEQLSEEELGITDPECARIRQELIAARYKKLNGHIKIPEAGFLSHPVKNSPSEIPSVPYPCKIKSVVVTYEPENQSKPKSVSTPPPVIHVLCSRSATSANLSQGLRLQRGTPGNSAFDSLKALTARYIAETGTYASTAQAQIPRAASNNAAHIDQGTYLQRALVDPAGATDEDTSRENVEANPDPALGKAVVITLPTSNGEV